MQFGSGWNVNVDLINFRFLVVFVLNVFFFFLFLCEESYWYEKNEDIPRMTTAFNAAQPSPS